MARKKVETGAKEAPAPVSKTGDLLRKAFGDGVLVPGSAVADKKREVLSLSPRLDFALGGGILAGTLVTLAGPSGCGKTSTALRAAAQWQKKGRKVYFIAAEHRIFQRDLTGVEGLKLGGEHFEILQSYKGRIYTAQEFLQMADTILRTEEDVMVILDSFSILSEASEMTANEYGPVPVGGSNRLVGSFCRRMSPVIPVNNNILIGIAHFYTNIGGQKKWAVSLGSKVNYARATGLVCDWSEPIMTGDKPTGQVIHWKVERSPLGPPNVKVDSILTYGIGIDEVAEAVDMGCDFGILSKGGSWVTVPFAGDQKLQGTAKTCEFFRENPEHMETLREKLRYFTEAA